MTIISLHYTSEPIITKPVDRVAYLLRHFVYNPGFVSTLNADQEISLRGLITRYPDDPQMVADSISNQLNAAIKREVPELALLANVSFEFKDANNYKITLEVRDTEGNPFIPSKVIEVDEGQFKFNYIGV